MNEPLKAPQKYYKINHVTYWLFTNHYPPVQRTIPYIGYNPLYANGFNQLKDKKWIFSDRHTTFL
jgi:hypothetical protein